MLKRTWVIWTLAIIIFLGSAVYQRLTGPTHPARGSVEVGGQTVKYRLERTHGGLTDCTISLILPDTTIEPVLAYKRFKSNDEWSGGKMERHGDTVKYALPHQPPAGKLKYRITLINGEQKIPIPPDKPVVIRFKGAVPKPILYSHILFMSLAMILANVAGLTALGRGPTRKSVIWTIVTLFIGGLILGPVVQKYAFGAFWTGWPIGHDLTDNKTAFAFIFWIIAFFRGSKGRNPKIWIIIAAIVTLGIYLIPHSMLGSELDYSKTP